VSSTSSDGRAWEAARTGWRGASRHGRRGLADGGRGTTARGRGTWRRRGGQAQRPSKSRAAAVEVHRVAATKVLRAAAIKVPLSPEFDSDVRAGGRQQQHGVSGGGGVCVQVADGPLTTVVNYF
jgi:hypothetical protein